MDPGCMWIFGATGGGYENASIGSYLLGSY